MNQNCGLVAQNLVGRVAKMCKFGPGTFILKNIFKTGTFSIPVPVPVLTSTLHRYWYRYQYLEVPVPDYRYWYQKCGVVDGTSIECGPVAKVSGQILVMWAYVRCGISTKTTVLNLEGKEARY